MLSCHHGIVKPQADSFRRGLIMQGVAQLRSVCAILLEYEHCSTAAAAVLNPGGILSLGNPLFTVCSGERQAFSLSHTRERK